MKGITLIETITTIALFILIMGAVSGFIVFAYKNYDYGWNQSRAIDEARRGVETMIKEARQAESGEDGSYPIEKAEDKEFIFYSDIDKDGHVERVRYFLGTVSSGTLRQNCVSFIKGGVCNVSFANFLTGNLKSSQLKVTLEGDLGASNEYAEIFVDFVKLANVCQTGCNDCPAVWQGTSVFDVSSQAVDNSINITADAASYVDPSCNWQEPNHSFKADFELSWTEEITAGQNELKKGIIDPVGYPPVYPRDQEKVSTLTSYVRNASPIFKYFDAGGNEIIQSPARLTDTKMMKIFLVINIDPSRPPQDFELESFVQLRNLKEE